MKYKPGDVIWHEFNDEILLVLKAENWKYEEYKVFILSSLGNYRVGFTISYCANYSTICLLKDKKLLCINQET